MKKISGKIDKILSQFKRGNSGSITLFVLIAMIFFITIGIGIYVATSNTLQSQSKEVSKMENDYKVDDSELDEKYEDIVTDETSNMHIILIKPSNGNRYVEGTWANEDLLLKVIYPDDVLPEDQYVYIDGEKKKYEEGMMIDHSCIIEINVWGRKDSVEVKIDKTPPIVSYNPNGGIYGVDNEDKTATIKTVVTIDDLGNDGSVSGPVLEFEYCWTDKNEKPTDGWQTSSSGSEIIKENAGEGVYYLWVKAKDNAGNETITFSKAFTVKKSEQLITIDATPKTVTAGNVIAKITYHELLTDKKAGWGKTLEEAKENMVSKSKNIENITVEENGFVYAEGKDTSGKLITKSYEITNIDKYPPVYDSVEIKNITTTGYDVYVYGVKDIGVAGMNRVQFPTWAEMNGRDSVPDDWETNKSLTGEKQSDGTTWKYHVDNANHDNAYGKFHTEIYIYDNVGNKTKVVDDDLENIQVPGIKITYDFKTNGGTSASKTTDTIKRGGKVDLTPTATKAGWQFVGWNTDKNASKGLTSLNADTKDITLYAIFSKTYSVTFNYYEGTTKKNQIVPITIFNTSTSGKINTPSISATYSDWTKNGWTLSEDPTTTAGIGEGSEITVNADTTYYMLYKKTVTANLYTYNNQISKKTGTIAANTAKIDNILNATINLGTTSLDGYAFRGWSTAKEANANITIKPSGDVSIKVDTSYYASYTYTVTGTYKYYNGSAYTSSTANATAYMNYVGSKVGGTPTAPTTKTPDGWTNRGWSTDPSSQATVATPGAITTNTTYYYSWQKGVTATLYYYNNQKTTKSGTSYMDYAGKITEGNLNLGTITLDGYTFRGWSTSNAANASITVQPNGVANIHQDTTYYGSYTYTVTGTYKYYNGSAYTTSTANATAYMNYVGTKIGGTPKAPTVSTPSGWTNRGWSTNGASNAQVATPGAITTNTTYYYSWQKTVTATLKTYNDQTGTKTGTAYLDYAGKVTNASIGLGTTTLDNYTFRGWSTSDAANANITIAANGTASINTNTTYYASYTYGIKAILYTYNNKQSTVQGSAYMNYKGVKANGTINLGTTSLDGYTFRGWSTAKEANASINVQPNGSVNIQTDTTYYASYTYTVTATLKTYNNQTGTKTGTAYMNYVGTKVNASIALGTTSLDNYTFRGWSTSDAANANITIAANGTASINANTTYYASYTYGITATLYTYNNQKTTKTGSAYMNYTGAKANGTINLGTTSLDGYTFRGWSTNNAANASITVQANGNANIQANTTYYASYTYTVTATYKYYNGSAYTSSTANATAYMNYVGSKVGGTPAVPTVSTPSGWTNRGWSTNSASNAQVATPGVITTNTTYYYSWQKGVTATLYYYNNQKTTKAGTSYMDYAGKITEGNLNLGTITLDGYTFRGWSTSNAANASITVQPNGVANIHQDTTYYGSYSYTVTGTYKYYNGSAYTTSTATATAYMNYVGTKIGGTPTAPTVSTPSGWTNRGWSTNGASNAQVATPGAITTNTTYYYSWQRGVTATLYYYNNQKTTKAGTAYMDYAGKITEGNLNLGTITLDGYTFRGWSTSNAANANITIAANGTASINTNTTYYASYSYTVTATYKYYNGSSYTTSTANATAYMNYVGTKIGGTPTAPTVSTPSGWSNRGWSTDPSAKAAVATPGAITTNTTYYYSWQKTVTATLKTYNNQSATKTGTAYLNYAGSTTNASIGLGTITLSGYTFRGWSTSDAANANITIAANGTASINTNTTYYASYTYGITVTLYTYNNQKTTKAGSAYMNYVGTKANGSINLGTTSLDGYTFRGWSTSTAANASITVAANGNASVQANTTYYASYSYTVTGTYKYYNGSAYTTSTATATAYMNYVGSKVGGTPTAPTVSTPSGWTNRGWSTNSAANASVATPGAITTNTTYYYSWQKTITATLYTYNNQKTTKSGTAYLNYAGSTTNASIGLGTTTLTNYTFRGWSTSNAANASITVAANGTASINTNTTYYASYSYTVTGTYKYYNGSSYTTSTANATAYMNYVGTKVGGKPTAPTTSTPSGWTNRGWSTDPSAKAAVATPGAITTNTTYYYSWQKTVTATLYTYNNQKTTKSGTAYLNYAGSTTNASIGLGTTTLSGYTFRGWSTSNTANASITVQPNGNASISGNTTYYASYSYTVTATYKYYNGSSYTTSTATATAYMNYVGTKIGGTPTAPTTNTPSGWTNRGWSTSGTANASVATPGAITTNTTYYYSWQKTVKVTYSLNGGSGTAPTAQTGTAYLNYAGTPSNPSFTMPSTSSTKTGYNFGGWNTNTSGTGTNYTASQKVSIANSCTLYAKWNAKQVVVTFIRNTSSTDNTSVTQTFTYGKTGQSFSNKGWSKTGATLIGWNETRTATTAQYSTLSGVSDSWIDSKSPSVTLYAVWKSNNYTMTFDNNYYSGNLWNDTYLNTRYDFYQTTLKSVEVIDDAESDCGAYTKITMNAGPGGPYYKGTKLTSGKTYTWRVTIRASSNKTLLIGQEQNGRKNVNVTTEWQTFTQTFTANDNQYYAFTFYLPSGNWNSGDVIYVKSLEIMEGTPTNTTMSKASGTAFGTLPAPTRTGYTFKGWFTKPVGGNQITSSSTVPTANTTYYAHWNANKYNIDYYTSAWNVAKNDWDYKLMKTVSYYYGRILTLDKNLLSAPTGYDPNTLFYSGNVCRTDAQWEHPLSSTTFSVKAFNGRVNYNYYGKYYNIKTAVYSYKLDGTWVYGGEKNESVQYSTKYVPSLNGLTQPYGHYFSSWWQTTADGFIVTGDYEIHAEFKPWQHTLAYNANGGTGAPASQTKTFGYVLNLSTQIPTRSNYTFVSWNTKSNGTGTSYSPGQNYQPDQNGGTVTLYAIWKDATDPNLTLSNSGSTQYNYTCTVDGVYRTGNKVITTKITASDAESGISSIKYTLTGRTYGDIYKDVKVNNGQTVSIDTDPNQSGNVMRADIYTLKVTVTNGAGRSKTFNYTYTIWGWQVIGDGIGTDKISYMLSDGTYYKNKWIEHNGHFYWLNNEGHYKVLAWNEGQAHYDENYSLTINGHSYSFRSYGSLRPMDSGSNINWQQIYHTTTSYDWIYHDPSNTGDPVGFIRNRDRVYIAGDQYSFDQYCHMVHDQWINIGNDHYYARSWGAYYHDQTVTINGRSYTFDSSGRCTNY